MTVLIYILLLLAPKAEVDQAIYLFQQGNEFYKQARYEKAIEQYEDALKMGYESAELYYNLGNAYFKSKEIGRAILNYERARKLAPRDQDVLYNLQIVQLYVVDKIVTPPPFFLAKIWRQVKTYFNSNQLGIFSLVLYFLTVILLIVRMLAQKEPILKIARYFLVPILIVFILTTGLFLIRINDDHQNKEAIVLVDKVDVLSSPADDATEVFALHEGAKVSVYEKSGSYLRIGLPDGKVGWLKQDAIEII